MRVRSIVLAMAVLVAAAMPAGAEPTLRTERVYFTCAGDTKAQNLSTQLGEIPGWTTTAPEQSVQEGAGCGFYDNAVWISSAAPDETFRATWEGTFVGNLDALTIEAHNIYAGTARTGEPFEGLLGVYIDGVMVAQDGFQAVPERSSTGLSEAIEVSVAGLGLTDEDGDGEISRTIRIELATSGATQSVWVWDTTEVPAGITFNPDGIAEAVVPLKS